MAGNCLKNQAMAICSALPDALFPEDQKKCFHHVERLRKNDNSPSSRKPLDMNEITGKKRQEKKIEFD